MKAVFRADASVQIGTGHVMRCLTLAHLLKAKGAECHFICRDLPGNRIEHIADQGFCVHRLKALPASAEMEVFESQATLTHAAWLGCTPDEDRAECEPILAALNPSWLIVDHYALDAAWETALAHRYAKLLVIDDLADRQHHCQLLLDQTFSRTADEYQYWVPEACTILCGSKYALLRPEFAEVREHSLARRLPDDCPRSLLIAMGGVDKDNATGLVLDALRCSQLPVQCQITVIMGDASPHLHAVQQKAKRMPWATAVLVDTQEMAQLMAESDFAIGAAGATSWERCCLGLPAIMVVLAENQQLIARGLAGIGAVEVIESSGRIANQLPGMIDSMVASPERLYRMSQAARQVTDGRGASLITQLMEV